MRNIVVIYKGDDWHKDVPFTSIETRKSFENWHERGLNYKIAMYRASIQWYDLEKNVFNKAWAFRNGEWQKVKGPIKPHLIYDKIASKWDYDLFGFKLEMQKKVKLYNSPLFRTMVDNKLAQYFLFDKFMIKSFLAQNKEELTNCLSKIRTQNAVIKPLYGSGGFGIIICDKKDAIKKRITYPVFVQEFIKTAGIPGFSKGSEVSDLRMVYINHKLIYALSRIAKKGSLFTNFHQGACAVLVKKNQIPAPAIKVAKEIQEKLKLFPEANYSLDFMFDKKGKPYLVEMNTTPGFDLLEIVGNEEIKKEYFEEFIKVVK